MKKITKQGSFLGHRHPNLKLQEVKTGSDKREQNWKRSLKIWEREREEDTESFFLFVPNKDLKTQFKKNI